MRKQAKILFLMLAATLSLSGCKLAVIMVEGGKFDSASNFIDCNAKAICIYDIFTLSYNDTYTAVPDVGWKFVRWQDGKDFICGQESSPICELTLSPLFGNPLAQAILEEDNTHYVMPVFEQVPLYLEVDGKQWMQPKWFTNIEWVTISQLCPGGACAGSLNGVDLTGWTWATPDDLNGLFNFYIGAATLGPGPSSYTEADSAWAPNFLDTWLRTDDYTGSDASVIGFVRELSPGGAGLVGSIIDKSAGESDLASTGGTGNPILKYPEVGAWFYRVP